MKQEICLVKETHKNLIQNFKTLDENLPLDNVTQGTTYP